jgi:hypothetical protein
MIWFLLLVIPLAIAGGTYYLGGREVTRAEFAGQLLVSAACAALSMSLIQCGNTQDVEQLNGRVRSKERVRVSCEHSYPCNCRPECYGSGEDEVCTTVCDTCYEHSFDYDWRVLTSVGWLNIRRIDSQGTREPPRFTQVVIGEPATLEHTYTNFLKGAPDSLFNAKELAQRYAKSLPEHPRVYDYYRTDRALVIGKGVPGVNPTKWSRGLDEVNARIGPRKQANLIMVFTDRPPEFFEALQQQWLGGKKNEIVIVVGQGWARRRWISSTSSYVTWCLTKVLPTWQSS